MKKLGIRLALALTLVTGLCLPSSATNWLFQALLTGMQEVPPNGSNAVGVASMSYDDVSNRFNLAIFVTGLDPNEIVGSHIHRAPFGVNGPVIYSIGTTYQTTQSGISFMGTDLGPLDPGNNNENEIALLNNNAYINIHTNAFPGGEIRGQLIVIPEPGTVAALAAGLGMLVLRFRRRK